MSSIGQAVGGLVGGAIGFFVGGPSGALYGAQIGMSVGGLLDPPKTKGPRLEDLSVQTSTYGAFIPRIYGTAAVTGNIIWIQGDKLIEQEKTTSGKGGPEITTYSYYATFAVGVCEGPIAGIRKIWIGGQLWYDAGTDDLESILASNHNADGFVWYPGNEAQEADPLIQADKGIADTPAYRGLAYVVFEMLPLEKYGNSLAGTQVKFEVVTDSNTAPIEEVYSRVIEDYIPLYMMPINPEFESDVLLRVLNGTGTTYDKYSYRLFREVTYPSTKALPASGWYGYAEGLSTEDQFVRYSSDLSYLNFEDQNAEEFYTGYSTSLAGTDNVQFIQVGDVIWSFFKKVSTSAATFTVVYVKQIIFQEVRKVQALADKYFTYAYDEDREEVVLARSGSFERYDFETGEYIASVSTSFSYNSSATGSISDGVFWQIYPDTTFRYLKGYSLSSGTLLYTYSWEVAGSSALCRGYVNNNLLFWVNEGSGSTHFFSIYRLPHGSLDGNTIPLGDIVSAECLKSNLIEAADIDVTDLTDDVRGYRVSQSGPLRGSIDPLRKAWPFDVRQHGYQIEFVRRGGSSIATIPADDLDAREAGQQPGISITDVREMDLILPQQVNVKYLDTVREYDINEQSDERTSTDAVNVVSIDLPLVMVASEAKATATMLLYQGWLDRYDVQFVLPPAYQQLEPADIVTINADNATYSLRLTSVNYLSDGRLECRAKYNDAAIYTQTQAVADEGASTPALISLAGPTDCVLMDIPLIEDVQDAPGFPVAMGGIISGWQAGLLYASDDGGGTWTNVMSAVSPGASIGTCENALSEHISTVYDNTSLLTVAMAPDKTLASVTEAQLFAGQNWFAYGADGRWEIIAARTVTLQVDGSYILQDFLRGQRGTEWATDLHEAGDTIVLLDSANIGILGMSLASIGVEKTYRAITVGDTLDTDSNRPFTYNGVNLECLPPVHLTGWQDSSGNWTLTWVRQSRFVFWRDYVDSPVGEDSELYDVDIFSDNTYSTVVRTFTDLTSATTPYTSAQQVTDFGGNQFRLFVGVYQKSTSVGRGYGCYQAVQQDNDPSSQDNAMLLHFDGTNGSTVINDSSGDGSRSWSTAASGATISTAWSKFGGASLLTSGTGTADYITRTDCGDEFNFGYGDFTFDVWLYPTTITGLTRYIFHKGSTIDIHVFINASDSYKYYFQAGSGAAISIKSDAAAATGAAVHFAVVRYKGTTKMYINGTAQSSTHTGSVNIPNGTTTVLIAKSPGGNGYTGYMDEFRIKKGAVWTTNFTPPTVHY